MASTTSKTKSARTAATPAEPNTASTPAEPASAETPAASTESGNLVAQDNSGGNEQESNKPVSAPPSRPADQRIMSIAATIMIEYPENGATAEELAAHTGIDAAELAQLLTAMAFADAAVKNVGTDGQGGEVVRWSLGSVKPSAVDPGKLPPCPTCGLVPPPIRASGSAKRTNGTGGARGGVNADGKPTLRAGELANMVKDLVAEHPGVKLSASDIAKELSIRNDRNIGASSVAYTIDAMLKSGVMTTDPRK